MNIDDKIFAKHCDCEVAVDRNYIPKKYRKKITSNHDLYAVLHATTYTPPALICVTHGRWLKWLSPSEATQIESVLRGKK